MAFNFMAFNFMAFNFMTFNKVIFDEVIFDEVSNPRHCTLLSRRLWQKFIWSDNPFIAFNLKTTFQKLNNEEEETQLLPLKPWDRILNRSQCFKCAVTEDVE
jgi:hypothetical protein